MSTETRRHFAPRHLVWGELTRQELAAARDRNALVLIPTGSIEQHGDHLPVETDALLSAAVAEMAAAAMADTPVLVAPAVPFGFTPHHLSWPGTISLRLDTYLAMLADIARSIIEAGFPRAVFVNGHGGNSAPLRSLVGELVTDGLPVAMVDYFAPAAKAVADILAGDLKGPGHACEMEAALLMAVSGRVSAGAIADRSRDLPPRLIQPWIAPGGDADPISTAGAGWAAIFHADDCGYYGDPGAATPATGSDLLDAVVSELAAFLEAFARTPLRLGIARDATAPRIAPPIVD